MDRRGFLATGVVGLLSGCSFTSIDDGPTYPRLESVVVLNDRGEPQDVELRVRRGDEVVHHRTYEVPAAEPTSSGPGQVTVEKTWSDEHGEYFVDARAPGDDAWHTMDLLAAEVSGECMSVQLRLRDGEEIRWFTNNECRSTDSE